MEDQQAPSSFEGMTTLAECLDIAGSRGYTAEFSITAGGLCIAGGDQYFRPDETHIDNFYRFEGSSNPDDMSILYLIKTADGTMGTLIDAYGTYSDSGINDFVKAVHDIHKAAGE